MITKKLFCEILENIQLQNSIDEQVSKSLETISDTWVMINSNNKIYKVLFTLLEEVMNDNGDWISWWLYEDVDKVVTFNNGEKIIVKTPEQLYDFLVKDEDDK